MQPFPFHPKGVRPESRPPIGTWRGPTLHAGLLVALMLGTMPQAKAQAQQAFTLEDLLRLARDRNPTLQALRSEAESWGWERREAARLPNPEVEVETGKGEDWSGENRRRLGSYTFRQSLPNPLLRRHELEALGAVEKAAWEAVEEEALEVDYEVRFHFYRILFLERALELARLNEEALASARDLVAVRAHLGEVRELEAVRLRVEHLRSRNQVEGVRQELDQVRRHLNTFLGNVLPEGFVLRGSLENEAPVPELSRLLTDRLPHHPALRRLALEKEAAAKRAEAAGLAWWPTPVLSGTTGKGLDGTTTTLGLGFRLPLFNQNRQALERDRQRARAVSLREEALRLELEAQAMIHLNHLRLNAATLSLFREALLEQAEAGMNLAEAAYREGEVSLVEYLDARRTYHSIQMEYLQALYEWNVEWAALERATGGGKR